MKFEIKDIIYIIVIVIGGAISYGAMQSTIKTLNDAVHELQNEVKQLKTERDALIVVQTQQVEMVKRLDKSDEKLDKIYSLVYSLSKP